MRHGVAVALKTNAKLHIVWVKNPASGEKLGATDDNHMLELAQAKLAELEKISRAEAPGHEINSVILEGKPYLKIAQYAENLPESLLIVGSHGASGFEEMFVGSNTMKIVGLSKVPVLIIGSHVQINRDLTKVLLPIDTSFETLQKVKFSCEIAKAFSAKVSLLGICMPCTSETRHLIVTVGAGVIGIILGAIVALTKIIAENNPNSKWLKIPNAVCDVYVTVIRGTPMALQLFVMAFVIFAIRGFPEEVKAIIAFGFNSGAYVSENIRAGIMSVDKGQTEAGRSLGLSGKTTLIGIVLPQGVKNVIPAIGNELIALVKETSIVSMVGMFDLTQASKVIGSGQNLATFVAPMVVVACFYLIIVYAITLIIKLIERRLRASDIR